MMTARDWSRTSTTLRSLAPQASASAYSATRALDLLLIIDYLLMIVNCQFSRFENYRVSCRLLQELLLASFVIPEQDLQSLAECVAGAFA